MTDTLPPSPANAPPPARRWSWRNVLLVISLALNLLVLAGAATRVFVHPPGERIAGMSYLQLVPRRFLGDLDRSRRDALIALLHDYRDRFRGGQQKSRDMAEALATALAANPYDAAQVQTALDAFTRNGSDLIAIGGQAAMEFISHLDQGEREKLAARIRERAKSGRRG